MKYLKLLCAVLITGSLGLTSCKEENEPKPEDNSSVAIELTLPDNMADATVVSSLYKFTNVTTSLVTEVSDASELSNLSLEPGLYDVLYEAEIQDNAQQIYNVRAMAYSVEIKKGLNNIPLVAYLQPKGDDLIIAEIFFAGTQQASGNAYIGDDYIKLYNNTDHVIYADGISIFESEFITVEKFDYTPDIMSEAMSVDAIYTVPGNGTDYPVQPGEYFLIADNAIDHRVANPNSFDLSHADFEWYDESSNPNFFDIDSPSAPNLDKWYCYTMTMWMLHNRGFKAYGIARIPKDKGSFLKENFYEYEYDMVLEVGTFPMSQEAFKINNEWILDVVNLSVESERVWNVSHSSLDAGWTYCGTIDKDPTRFFHSVRRKMIGLTEDGHPVLQDTNNSSLDFNPNCIASEIEFQGTAIDPNGTKVTTLTYDGLTPMIK